ncbi:MAG: hypothetical protein PHV82_19165, partial [Victivallaceae bacterium]|nr:hypothetical protein [Victivallaceae bacterium]
RIIRSFMDIFQRNLTGIETYNLNGCDGDIYQLANWQAFGAGEAYCALLEGIIGIQWDIGGFRYVPCEIPGEMTLGNFKFRKGRWNISLKGEGAFTEKLLIDGNALSGSMKVPGKYLNDKASHNLAIVRSRKPFDRPVLLAATDAEIGELRSTEQSLRFTVLNEAHTSLKIYSPVEPAVEINRREVKVEWDKDTSIFWCDLVIEKDSEVNVSRLN